VTPVVVTAWETYSPLGHGAQAHLAGLAATGYPAGARTTVDNFDVRQVLGRTGTRSMDRAAGLAVATTRRLLERLGYADAPFGPYARDEVGLVLGTSDGTRSVMDFLRDTWTREKPYDVDPSHVPRTLMNFAAGQCAIWHGVKGPNATICGGHATGLLALNYARRLQRNGHAEAVFWGAVEELSAERVAVEAARPGGHGAPPPSEGCVIFLLESIETGGSGRSPLAEVLAVEFGVWAEPDGITDALATCLRTALLRASVKPMEVLAVAPTAGSAPGGFRERAAVTEVFGDCVPMLTASLDAVGDARAVSTAYQIVELLAALETSAGIGAVTAVDTEGRVGCALLRIR
jgi:3-oxoacyl-[acyl-carrier-protein] synthase II